MKLSEMIDQAREALDSMDDFARMDAAVDAIGPRGVLERFINEAADLARRVEGAAKVKVRGKVGEVCMVPVSHDHCGKRVALVPLEGE